MPLHDEKLCRGKFFLNFVDFAYVISFENLV